MSWLLPEQTLATATHTKEVTMSATTPTSRLGKLATLAVATAAFGAMMIPLAPVNAQIYPGWDFGNGIGIGIGPPPSAYNPCPTYGWPVYPYPCAYRYYGHAYYHSHHFRHYHRYSRASQSPG
jgi:hypothetical protein